MMIEITTKCNRNCPICEANIPERANRSMKEAFGIRLINALLNDGVENFSFTGGEPTMAWNTLTSMLRHCTEKGVPTRLYSNAITLNDDRIHWLEKHLKDIVVSFDSMNPEVVEILRGSSTDLSKVKNNIVALCKSKLRVFAISVCSTVNLEDLHELPNQLEDWGVDGWWIQQYISEGLGAAQSANYAIDAGKFQETIRTLESLYPGPIRSFPSTGEYRRRVFVNCDGNFINYLDGSVVGSVLDKTVRNKVLKSGDYMNARRQ